ncbi:LVIVD repeat-containing protein [Porphyromonas endodontalis]
MRKSILVSFAVLFAAVVTVGCQRTPKNKEYVYDVYAVGYEGEMPMLWKNGEPTVLSHDGKDDIAMAVFVPGNDVYAAGLECVYDGGQDQNNPSRYVGVFWKNGVISRFTDLAGKTNDLEVNDLFVSGSDVYVVGQDKFEGQPKAMLWKNGIAEPLSDGSEFARAYSVFVSGNDVYVAGYHNGAALWKNKTLSKYTNDVGCAYSVFVSGNDVYVAGWDSQSATLWKNGVAEKLTDGSNPASARSVFVSGNDIYVVGSARRGSKVVAMLWTKRGESGSWESKNLTDGSRDAYANSIYVIDNHIYIAGVEEKENSPLDIAMLWTKAPDSDTWEAKKLTNGEDMAKAYSVYAVKREK